MYSPKILVVDDETYIVELVKFNLEKEGYRVIVAFDGIHALEMVREENPHLILLDIMLPSMDGLEVCRTLKQDPNYNTIPIIMLTAKGDEFDTVLGLEMGADDYIKKPFSPREMVARVKARLRALKILEAEKAVGKRIFVVKDLIVIPDKYEAFLGEEKLELTPKEFELLTLMASNQGKVFTREALLEKVWGYEYSGDTRTVDVHIRHLRQKLRDDSSFPLYIETVRGVGYRFIEGSSNG
ncbi:MAG: response regulator transcription factor [Syntrophomonadaceae bacterium]|nr:response regulator transcription factor [Syntrophomonadaceae bacterium]MDD3270920.1 response regulator transcription factor [Syntrophomonadaceae bacterium]MDD3897481.1 response regulator transcription factor [Syntrophomonadaceae bacterium]MDD4561939.1 response regulator transcription factor [Syntrophomonadaceae bacterium]